MLAFSHHTLFLTFSRMTFPSGYPVLLNTDFSAFVYHISFMRGTSMGFMCAHGGVCAMHDLFGQCILRSGSECPSSHCVGVHVPVYCISVLFCPDWLICSKHFLAAARLLFSSMSLSCLPSSRWARAFNPTFLWCCSFTCRKPGTTAFGQVAYVFIWFNHVRPYWIYK